MSLDNNEFKLNRTIGQHSIYQYSTENHRFIEYFNKLFNCYQLEKLHLQSDDYNNYKDIANLGFLNDRDTDLHNLFYKEIKNNDTFKELYCKFIKSIHKKFYSDQKYILYQSFPCIRIQYPDSVCIPPHKDSDNLSNHPLGERNYILPITKMENTNTIIIESYPDNKDFQNILLNYGELLHFNGNTCTHYNESNKEGKLRISLDFRIILMEDYFNYLSSNQLKKTNPRDIDKKRIATRMVYGGYYQLTELNQDIKQMMKWQKIDYKIIQHRPYFDTDEADACYKYMLNDSFVTEFKKTLELENQLANYIGSKHCIMTTSGTSALLLSLMALDLKEGDEVMVPNYTMIATINVIKMLKLEPVIVDVNSETFTLDISMINNQFTPKTKCIIHVSLNNRHKGLQDLKKYCESNNVYLLEDSAQSLGCKYQNKHLGTFGNLGCFSLSTPKIISTGQGGFIVTDDDNLNNKLRRIKNFGRESSGNDNFIDFGLNFKFTDIQAVIGIEQLKKLDNRVIKMRQIYDIYYQNLKDLNKDNNLLILEPLNKEWIPWFVDILVDNRQELIVFLEKHNINTRPVYQQINKSPIYYQDTELLNSKKICYKGLFLPSHINITEIEILYICNLIKLFIHKR